MNVNCQEMKRIFKRRTGVLIGHFTPMECVKMITARAGLATIMFFSH